MTKTLEKFLENIKNLENYFILKEDKDYLLLGTKITLKQYIEISGQVFISSSKIVDRTIYITFMIVLNPKSKKIEEYQHKQVPYVFLPSIYVPDEPEQMQIHLDNFVFKLCIKSD